ncbi:MAG: iron dependent repressor, metal binding and dimerization domain protein [Nitriliruptoraceae bacterium]
MSAVLHDAASGHGHGHGRGPTHGPTPSVEDHGAESHGVDSLVTEVLEILLEHHEQGVTVAAATIVSRLPVDPALVDAALVRLLEAGTAELVDASQGELRLSGPGVQVAVTAVRRHRLTERLLSDVIGLEWWKVHHEAERWEGVVSGDVEAKLIELLGDPGTCPHGNPIPGSRHAPEQSEAILLADAPVGPVHVLRITETLEGDDEALQLLQNCGFLPGKDAEVQRIERGWVQVAGAHHDAALPPHVAAHTYVAPR